MRFGKLARPAEEGKVARTLIISLVILAFLATQAQFAFAAISLQGTVPVGRNGLIIIQPNNQSGSHGTIKFKFSAPAAAPGGYVLAFCIGPASNPCGLPTSYVVSVPASESRLAVVDASTFTNNVLVVVQGTNVPVPFAVDVE
jgi:hypothetical protein